MVQVITCLQVGPELEALCGKNQTWFFSLAVPCAVAKTPASIFFCTYMYVERERERVINVINKLDLVLLNPKEV